MDVTTIYPRSATARRYKRIDSAPTKLFPALWRTPPRRRLWLTGSAMAIFLLTLIVGNQFIPRSKAVTGSMLGHDFLPFYTAGTFLRQGRIHDLYNLDAVRDFEQSTAHGVGLEVGKSFGPWWNPPFYALLFEPLSLWTYPQALNIWRCINLCALCCSLILLARMIGSSDWRNWGLPPLLVLVSMPLIQSLSHGQNTCTSLFLLAATVTAWRSNRSLLTGMLGGLLFYKPQLGAVVAAAMVFDLGWPALVGLAATGSALMAINMAALPGTLADYLHRLPAIVQWMQIEHAYLWERHVTLKAFWRLLFQGRQAGETLWTTAVLTYLSVAILGGALLMAIYRTRSGGGVRRDRLIAATILAMPLLMPFYFDYDLLLLAIPLTLIAAERLHRPELRSKVDLWQTRLCIALFFCLFVNPAVGFHTHVNGTVILLSFVCAFQAAKTARSPSISTISPQTNHPPLPLAA